MCFELADEIHVRGNSANKYDVAASKAKDIAVKRLVKV